MSSKLGYAVSFRQMGRADLRRVQSVHEVGVTQAGGGVRFADEPTDFPDGNKSSTSSTSPLSSGQQQAGWLLWRSETKRGAEMSGLYRKKEDIHYVYIEKMMKKSTQII